MNTLIELRCPRCEERVNVTHREAKETLVGYRNVLDDILTTESSGYYCSNCGAKFAGSWDTLKTLLEDVCEPDEYPLEATMEEATELVQDTFNLHEGAPCISVDNGGTFRFAKNLEEYEFNAIMDRVAHDDSPYAHAAKVLADGRMNMKDADADEKWLDDYSQAYPGRLIYG